MHQVSAIVRECDFVLFYGVQWNVAGIRFTEMSSAADLFESESYTGDYFVLLPCLTFTSVSSSGGAAKFVQ